MQWMVELAGDESDLSALAQSLNEADINVSHDGQRYVITSTRFKPSDDAQVVHEAAKHLVELLSGASRLALDSSKSIGIGAVYRHRENGSRDVFVFPEPAVIRFRAVAPTVNVTHKDGTVEVFHPADPVAEWMSLAFSDESVENAFRIIATGTLVWINLYKLFEIIDSDVGGIDNIANNGWATTASMKLFKHTANSPGALGLNARHGSESTQPPSRPMAISEARSLVNSVMHAWLRTKK